MKLVSAFKRSSLEGAVVSCGTAPRKHWVIDADCQAGKLWGTNGTIFTFLGVTHPGIEPPTPSLRVKHYCWTTELV